MQLHLAKNEVCANLRIHPEVILFVEVCEGRTGKNEQTKDVSSLAFLRKR